MSTLENRAEQNRQASWRATAAQVARTEVPRSRLLRDTANSVARAMAHVSDELAEVFRNRADYFDQEAERLECLALEMVDK